MENSMTIFVKNEDLIEDSSPAKNNTCSLCGFKFSQQKYLTNHYNLCKNIEIPAGRLGTDSTSVKNEHFEKKVQTVGVLEKDATITSIIRLKFEDLAFTEATIVPLECHLKAENLTT